MPRALQRAVRLLPGLLASLVVSTLPIAAPAPSAHAATRAQRAQESTPLEVAITSLTPGVIPAKGPIAVSGTVTNTDKVTWLDVGVYPFVGIAPITTADGLTTAMEQPADAEVGHRIVADKVSIPSIEPGQTVSYTLLVPRSDLAREGVGAPGVYWFGVHALGSGGDGYDQVADGRARTFLPLLAPTAAPVSATVIVPIRATVTRNATGAIADVERWGELLEPDGRLGRLLTLATSTAGHDVSWLVDPAVLAAVQQLAAGNPDRPLAPTATDGDGSQGGPSATADPTPGQEPADAGDSDTPDEATQHAATLAADWWTQMSAALQGADLLALPYGDLDLTGAGLHDTAVYKTARTRADQVLTAWGLSATPVNAPVAGVLDADAARLLRGSAADTPVLVSDALLPEAPTSPDTADGDGTSNTTSTASTPSRVRSAGLNLVPVDAAVGDGGPGPDEPLAGTALRQRVLAEAALRSLDGTSTPIVVQLPARWSEADAEQLAAGLRQPWLVPRALSTALAAEPLTVIDFDHLRIPASSATKALGSTTFDSASGLIRIGRTLQHVLTGNDTVADATLDEALADLSYQRRGASSGGAAGSVSTIASLLGRIRVQAPRAVTLSGSSGRIIATVSNDLDQPVTVTLKPLTDAGIGISTPKPVEIAAGAAATVLMQATGAHVGLHNVELTLTDKQGARFGQAVAVPVRAAQVSAIIWVFLAVGLGLLLVAIATRLIRRVRRVRRDGRGHA